MGVEELCDHCIEHKSNKLIEGRLDDVKRQFKPIALRWAYPSDNVEGLTIHKKITVGPANFKSLGKELKLEAVGKCYA
jgi:ABC-2 type transport system ATP-binding protein